MAAGVTLVEWVRDGARAQCQYRDKSPPPSLIDNTPYGYHSTRLFLFYSVGVIGVLTVTIRNDRKSRRQHYCVRRANETRQNILTAEIKRPARREPRAPPT
ncbi:hypothetical protein EVAR_50579_1 [Eumeta japonica]|uniref:Uncharacterized protein n=1 Tax=Eumeta variegata TaxID=151549 RepID=A0A4C1Y7R7_EUMVA|nr:hypothetical protein EVAR_50579_1 [Eumeta japonica]